MPREKFQTLTEQMFYILLCLRETCCGADIMEQVRAITNGRVAVGPGTLYHLLDSFVGAGMIEEVDVGSGGRKRSYRLTAAGRLERISGLGWHYRRAPAKKLTYAVEYFEEGSDFNAGLPNSQREFVEYCEAAGWQLTAW